MEFGDDYGKQNHKQSYGDLIELSDNVRSSQLSYALKENQRLMEEMRMLKNQSMSSMRDFKPSQSMSSMRDFTTFAKQASEGKNTAEESKNTEKQNSNEYGDSKNTEPEFASAEPSQIQKVQAEAKDQIFVQETNQVDLQPEQVRVESALVREYSEQASI